MKKHHFIYSFSAIVLLFTIVPFLIHEPEPIRPDQASGQSSAPSSGSQVVNAQIPGATAAASVSASSGSDRDPAVLHPASWQPVYKKPFIQKADAGKKIKVNGPEGTILRFPAHAFVHKDGTPVTGTVQIALEEYYELTDFLRAKLHTVSGEGLLESGGTIRVTATQDGEELQMAPGVQYDASFLVNKMTLGMKAWVWDSADGGTWESAGEEESTTLAWDTRIFVQAFNKAALDEAYFLDGEQGLTDYMNLHLGYPEDAREKDITGFADLGFTVNTEGYVKDVEVFGYNFPSFPYAGVEFLRKLRFAPAIGPDGSPLESHQNMHFEFPCKGSDDPGYTDEFRKDFDRRAIAFMQAPRRDKERWKKVIQMVEIKYTSLENALKIAENTRRIQILVPQTGLINCDAITGGKSRMNQVVRLQSADQINSMCFLSFPGTQAIIPDDTYFCMNPGKDRIFHSAPEGCKALLICLVKNDKDELVAGYKTITIGDPVTAPDNYCPLNSMKGILGDYFNPKKVKNNSAIDDEPALTGL